MVGRNRVKDNVTVIKHGRLCCQPSDVQEPISVVCPECGETWCGYADNDLEAFKDLWCVTVETKSKTTFGVTTKRVYNKYKCPECGCEFEITDGKKCERVVSETVLKVLVGLFILCYISAIIIGASAKLAELTGYPDGCDVAYAIVKILCVAGIIAFAVAFVLATFVGTTEGGVDI